MGRRLCAALTLLLVFAEISPAAASGKPHTGRSWTYAFVTGAVTPDWSFTAMPGVRAEFARDQGDSLGHYMDEFFIGPNWVRKFGAAWIRTSLWYYFAGYDNLAPSYVQTHNLALIATAGVRLGPFAVSARSTFLNTFYSDLYGTASQRRGYSVILCEKIKITYELRPGLALLLATEPFIGLVADGEAAPSMIGFMRTGLLLNRLYAGVSWRPTPNLSIEPQYVYHTDFDGSGNPIQHNHYLFVVVGYRFKFFEE